MGICWGSTLPDNDEETRYRKDMKFSQNLPSPGARKVVEFGKEEVKLDELLASLRTGLVFAPTEFPVLPGHIATTAKVSYTIGSSKLQRRQEENLKVGEEKNDPNSPNEEKRKEEEEADVNFIGGKQPFTLKVPLRGHVWAKGLVMALNINPVVGPFQGKTLDYHWKDDVLEVLGCKRGEIEAHTLPLSFESEVEFCKCCLLLTYQSSHHGLDEQFDDVDGEEEDDLTISSDSNIPSLTSCAYRVTVANLDTISSEINTISPKLRHVLFGLQDPVDISIALWPPETVNETTSLKMRVKSGILFAELNHLVREHFRFEPNQVIKLYKDYRPVHLGEMVSTEVSHLDCFVVSRSSDTPKDYTDEISYDTEASLVVSLVGRQIRIVNVDLEMYMRELDTLLRGKFELEKDSFLIILAEDDLAPQYMADDDWKCTYTFSIPDNSFSAGLRRSFRRLSMRRRGGGERPHTPGYETSDGVFEPLMADVIELLSSDDRHFPKNDKRCQLSVEELHRSMPMYQMSIEQCGIHPYSIIQVFEVTGPSIPITVQVLFDQDEKKDLSFHDTRVFRTRFANIMDINRDWSINTFLQYIDAVVSLSSTCRQKRLRLKDNSVDEDKDDLSNLKLGVLLDTWKPLWWAEKGCKRRQLTEKDIEPSEYLIVEKF